MNKLESLCTIELNLGPNEGSEIAGLGNVVHITPKDKVNDSGLKSDKIMFDELFRTPPEGFIIPKDNGEYDYLELYEEQKQCISKAMGWYTNS